jgi:hypothetical protein
VSCMMKLPRKLAVAVGSEGGLEGRQNLWRCLVAVLG